MISIADENLFSCVDNPCWNLCSIPQQHPNIGAYWGRPWQANIIKETNAWYILSFAYKWLGSSEIVVKALPDYSIYKKDKQNDSQLVTDLHKLLDECDVLVAHNSKFDTGRILSRCLVWGLKPPSPFLQYDTLKAIRRFGFCDNRLSSLAKYLKFPEKLDAGGTDTWMSILQGDKKLQKDAWEKLKIYNVGDIVTLEALYKLLVPWDKNHPKRSYFTGSEECDVCSSKELESRGCLDEYIYKTLF